MFCVVLADWNFCRSNERFDWSMDFFAKCGIMEIYSDIFSGLFKCPLFSDFENGKDIGV